MKTPTFETGATTAGANDLVLTVMNDGAIYRDRCHIGYAMLQGASHRGMTFRDICNDAARNMRQRYGSKFRPAEISEAARIVQDQTIEHCLETIRDGYDGSAIHCIVRRWFDSVNGNSYFTARIEIPQNDGWHSIIVPFQYGYGSHWEHVCADTVRRIGIENPAIRYVDSPYGHKRDLYVGGIYISRK
jgi:hypothetical protein